MLTRALRIPFDDLRDTSLQLFVEAICIWVVGEYFMLIDHVSRHMEDHLIIGYDKPTHDHVSRHVSETWIVESRPPDPRRLTIMQIG